MLACECEESIALRQERTQGKDPLWQSKIGVSVDPQVGLVSLIFFFKKTEDQQKAPLLKKVVD